MTESRAPAAPTLPELATWRRIRRHAVPPSMLAQATAARLAGDWEGACAAARVDTDIDLARVARDQGRAAADALAEDLAHLAPDLLRWHLPRHLGGHTVIDPYIDAVLTPSRTEHPDGPVLYVQTPTIVQSSQRLRLSAVRRSDLAGRLFYDAPGYTWDARRAGELRTAWGGSDDRPPLLRPDGSPVPLDRLGTGQDRAATTERVLLHLTRGEIFEAWWTAGIELDTTEPPKNSWAQRTPTEDFLAHAPSPVGLAREVARLSAVYGLDEVIFHAKWPTRLALRVVHGERVAARLVAYERHQRGRPTLDDQWRHPVDLHLMGRGLLDPDDLHPLVHASLFPGRRPPEPGRAEPPATEPIRVRCRGSWHRVQVAGGRVRSLDHDADEEERERTLRALGGTSAGCFAALQAWHRGDGRLPKALRGPRRDLVDRIRHGDTAHVSALLDAGLLDPWMRFGNGWTLLHMLLYLDHEPLLPRLLAAGLPIDVREIHGRTPLHVAVGNDGSPALARALFDAGADPTATDEWEGGIQELLDIKENPELDFLRVGEPR